MENKEKKWDLKIPEEDLLLLVNRFFDRYIPSSNGTLSYNAIEEAKKKNIGKKAILSLIENNEKEESKDYIDLVKEITTAKHIDEYLHDLLFYESHEICNKKERYLIEKKEKYFSVKEFSKRIRERETRKMNMLKTEIENYLNSHAGKDIKNLKENLSNLVDLLGDESAIQTYGYLINMTTKKRGLLTFDYTPEQLKQKIKENEDLEGKLLNAPNKEDEIRKIVLYAIAPKHKKNNIVEKNKENNKIKRYVMKVLGEYLKIPRDGDHGGRYMQEEEFEISIPVEVDKSSLRFKIDQRRKEEMTAIGKKTGLFLDYYDIKFLNPKSRIMGE